MADDPLKVIGFRKWNETRLQPGGGAKDLTKIRFFFGPNAEHGPFEKTFDRDVSDAAIEQAIRDERRALESHLRV